MPQSTAPLHLTIPGNSHLRTPDLLIIGAYLLLITIFGLTFHGRAKSGKRDRSLKQYFLAGNTVPWWAIALSVVSAETSTLTIISIPGVAFAGDFGFLQVVIGYLLGRVVVAGLFLPRYFAGEMLTAYQLIDRRFGPLLHKVTAALFLLTRAAAEGVRVFAVSIVVSIAIGTGDVLSIAIISALTLLYTFEGGLAAVIWTDVVQMGIYVAGTLVALITLGHHVPGGWPVIAHTAAAANKFHMLNFAMNLTQSYTFWAGVLGGTFLTMASHGTDQLMVQRLLAARNLRESQLALLSSGVVVFAQFAFFLLIGAGLWVFYGQSLGPHAAAAFRTNDYIFPTFIVREMPVGVAGLLVAAILAAAMSNLSAALNSLSSTTVVDFYMRARPEATDRERTLISKSSTALWAVVLFAIAVYSVRVGGKGHVVEIGLSIAAVAYGCLLGVFLLGTLTRFATEYGATVGMLCGFALNLWLWQGSFPVHLGFVTIPHIAFTWYVLIGAAATFAIGSLASLVLRQAAPGKIAAAALPLLTLLFIPTGICPSQAQAQTPVTSPPARAMPGASVSPGKADFSLVSSLINEAVAQHKIPGAVVVVGHNGHVVFQQAYGDRKLPGEPGLDGNPSPAEPMTEDTIFDMASLTKVLVTTTAIGQLYERGKLDFDTPVERYLPAFNPTHDPERSKVTLRLLLTHFSGEPPDVNLKDTWGLAAPDRAEGIHRALTTPLAHAPGAKFVYSDINFILLGALVEQLSGERLDNYAQEHIFEPLGMAQTTYHPFDRTCGPVRRLGAATASAYTPKMGRILVKCPAHTWSVANPDVAPTAHDDEGTATTNPDFDHLLRGTVDDPTTRRMGGVAGHAGVFSTAHDAALFATALLEKLLRNSGPFPLKQATLALMSAPEQPGHAPGQIASANAANLAAIAAGQEPVSGDPALLDPNFPAMEGQTLRGFGWDIDSVYSKPRGRFPIGSFGHTGYTGTSIWMDPGSDTSVVLLTNAIHPHPGAPVSSLRGEVATAAGRALHLYPELMGEEEAGTKGATGAQKSGTTFTASATPFNSLDAGVATNPTATKLTVASFASPSRLSRERFRRVAAAYASETTARSVKTGIDVLESTHFAALVQAAETHNGQLRLGLLTNQTGLDAHGRRTVDILASDLPKAIPGAKLTTIFSPEHGILGRQDTEHLRAETDPATGLHVTSLYGPHESDRRPSHEQLGDLDAVVIDLQDAGVRFYTYETVLGYFLQAAAREQREFHHDLQIVVLDRPDPIGGLAVQGPVSDPSLESYTDFMPIPIRHGMTLGELARYVNTTQGLQVRLVVIAMEHWTRDEFYDDTGLPWVNPSPNLRSLTAATLYPGIALLEMTNVSVGRGTDTPFEVFGAGATPASKTAGAAPAWFRAADVASALNARQIAGVRFEPTHVLIAEDANHYPFHGQTIDAVRVVLTDGAVLNSPELGIEILTVLHRLYPSQFALGKSLRLIANQATMDALNRGDDPQSIAAAWQPQLRQFLKRREPCLLYKSRPTTPIHARSPGKS